MIDGTVIDGHVIPGHVLFTAATQHDMPYETLAFGDNLKVTVSFTTEPDGLSKSHRGKYYFCFILIKMNNIKNNTKHSIVPF